MPATLALVVGSVLVPALPAGAAPSPGPAFNDPRTGSRQYAIHNRLIAAIDDAPRGSVIRMAFYSLSMQRFADALLRAHARGVHVKILMDDHASTSVWRRLEAGLGGNPFSRSWAMMCHRSCFTDHSTSYQHAKFYLFSTSGSAKRVVTVSSANPTNAQATVAFNDAYTVIDPRTYDAFKRYFEAMTRGALELGQTTGAVDRASTTLSGGVKSYFFPRSSGDTMASILSNVDCDGTARGWGTPKRHTRIRVAMFQWTVNRVNLARRLWNLDDQGCSVEVVWSGGQTSASVLSALRKKGGRYGGPILVNGSRDLDGDGTIDRYVHHKFVLIEGNYAGDTSSRLVFTGSGNFARNAERYSNEVMLRISGTGTYRTYFSHFQALRRYGESGAGRPVGGRGLSASESGERLPRPAD